MIGYEKDAQGTENLGVEISFCCIWISALHLVPLLSPINLVSEDYRYQEGILSDLYKGWKVTTIPPCYVAPVMWVYASTIFVLLIPLTIWNTQNIKIKPLNTLKTIHLKRKDQTTQKIKNTKRKPQNTFNVTNLKMTNFQPLFSLCFL